MSSALSRSVGEQLFAWRDDPLGFALGAFDPPPDLADWQREALLATAVRNKLAVRSAHNSGKTAWLAWTLLWFLLTRFAEGVKIGCTAPSGSQAADALWSEVALWRSRLKPPFRALVDVQADKVIAVQSPQTAFAVIRTARREQPEALAGLRAQNLAYILDETSGIDEQVFEVVHSSLASPNAKVFLISNPTRTSGFFYRAFDPAKKDLWWTKHVSFFDIIHMSWAAKDYPQEVAAEWGEGSNVYRVRVLGEFPAQDDDTVIPLSWIEEAKTRNVDTAFGNVVWGVDVARFGGDRSAVAKRRGNHLFDIVSWRGLDLMQTAGRIVGMYEMEKQFDRPVEILVDAIGYGAGVSDRLREQGLPARAINVAEKPAVGERYLRLRDELWFKTREWFDQRDCMIIPDDQLIAELASVRYSETSGGKFRVESKDEMRKRLAKSPDLADAAVLTMATSDRRIKMLSERDRTKAPAVEREYSVFDW